MSQAVNGAGGRPDINNAEYMIWQGAFPGHSGKPMQAIARQMADRMKEGNIKFVVIDPVLAGGNITPLNKSGQWLPIKPGTDSAFGMALIRWIIENEKYNKEFISSPNLEAADKKGYNSWFDATQLVIMDEGHENYRKKLMAEDFGFEVEEDEEIFIVIDDSTKEPVKNTECETADYLFDGEVETPDGKKIKVKSTFLLLKEQVTSREMSQYAEICGVPQEKIEEIANEFSSHGTKAVIYGMGNTASAHGADAARMQAIINQLVGSVNMRGGLISRRLSYKTAATGPKYNLNEFEGKPENKVLRISRTGVPYEKTSEYKNKKEAGENPYPSKLPWSPVGSGSDNQAIFSVIHQYPYQAKIVMNWMANPLLAVPAASRSEVIDKLKDPNIIPLFISSDIFMGEMTALADYIIPDTSPYESWGLANIEGNYAAKGQTVRWPAIEPATEKVNGRHISYETYLIDIADKLDLPGFGEDAIEDTNGKKYPIHSREDFYLRGLANMAYDLDPIADISKEDLENQDLENAVKEWKDILPQDEWNKVLNILAKGGRFEEDADMGFDGDKHIHGNFKVVNLYSDMFALGRSSYTGEYFKGIADYNPEQLWDGTDLREKFPETEWPFRAANYKPKFRSISLLVNSPSMRDLSKHNYVELNEEDAKELGISTMDKVKVIPATGGDFEGYALARPGIAKGTVGIAYGYGHWEYGARDFEIDGQSGNETSNAGEGVHLMGLIDPTVEAGIFGFSESSTGGPARNSGAYKIEKL